MDYVSNYPNRTWCDVLEDMRKCYSTYNFGGIAGLVEELQFIGNRMEAGLSDKKDVHSYTKKRSKLKREVKKLEEKRDKLKDEIEDLSGDDDK